ncbi:MAG: hypothetical protein HZC55_06735 [Verrucomicrobia bacterium]|nr:hypothetical protein [Verrucomicrobiota bacterium]
MPYLPSYLRSRWLAGLAGFGWLATTAAAQVIALNGVIGPAGTNAATVAGPGNAVNFTGVAASAAPTLLTAVGSTGSSSFNFGTGFGASRSVASSAGAGNVYADRKYDSSTPAPLILDRNNNGSFADETDDAPADPNTFHLGFGLHADTFITFDLAAIRQANGLPANQAFVLTGSAGVADRLDSGQTSAALIVDSTGALVFDWRNAGPYHQYDTFTLTLSGTSRFLTFAALAGLDNSNWGDHVGFSNLQLSAVPEPSAAHLILLGVAAGALGGIRRWRRRR